MPPRAAGRGDFGLRLTARSERAGAESRRTFCRNPPIEAKDAQDARGYARAQDEDFYRRQRELLGKVVQESDVVIAAAVIPGKKSPVLVTEDMVKKGMAPGSVILLVGPDGPHRLGIPRSIGNCRARRWCRRSLLDRKRRRGRCRKGRRPRQRRHRERRPQGTTSRDGTFSFGCFCWPSPAATTRQRSRPH